MVDRISYMNIEDIISQYDFFGQTFKQMYYNLKSNKYDAREIELLKKDLKKHGDFREPIVLMEGYSEFDEDTGKIEDYPPCIVNGCHRLIAYYDNGIKNIKVIMKDNDYYPEENTPCHFIDLSFTSKNSKNLENNDMVFDKLIDCSRFFFDNGETCGWLCVCSGSSNNSNITIMLEMEKLLDITKISAKEFYNFYQKNILDKEDIDPFFLTSCSFIFYDDEKYCDEHGITDSFSIED